MERTGHLQARADRGAEGQGDRRRALCGQHAGRCRRRRPGYADLAALRKGARPRQLCAALDLRGAALEHPARRHAGAAREISVPVHPRREVGLPRHDRARRRLRPARHEGDGRRGWRRLGAQRHQAFHQPCRHRRFRDRLHGVGRGRFAARQAQEDHRLLRRQGHQGLCRPRRLPQRLAPRLHQLDPRIRRLPAAQEPGAGRGASRLRGRQFMARRDAAAGRRDLPRPRRTGARPRDLLRRAARAVRPADRQVPGRLVQARRHGDGIEGRRPAGHGGRLEIRPGHGHRPGHGDGQAEGHRDARLRRRRGDPDPWRHGADGRSAAGAHLARRARRADLGRHQRDPAPHHQRALLRAVGG